MVLEIAEAEVVLRWGVIFHSLAGLGEVNNRFRVLLDLPIAISSVEQGLEVGLSSFDVLKSFSEILDGVGKVHQSCVYKTSIEVVESIIGFEADSFFELCKRIVDLVEHHHAVASIGIVLRIFIIESNRSSKVIHRLLIVSGSHEGVASIRMVLGMSGPLIIGRSGL